MAALPDHEKEQILLEERYREEVRKALQPRKSRRQSIAEFVNSPFAIWLLSSVVLAGLTSVWAMVSELSTNKTRFERVMVEIDYRLTTFERALDRYSREEGFTLNGALSPLTDPVHRTGGFAGTPAFPEFDQRTADSLLIELRVVADQKRKEKIEQILNILRRLQELEMLEDNQHPLPLDGRKTVVQKARDLVKELRGILYEG